MSVDFSRATLFSQLVLGMLAFSWLWISNGKEKFTIVSNWTNSYIYRKVPIKRKKERSVRCFKDFNLIPPSPQKCSNKILFPLFWRGKKATWWSQDLFCISSCNYALNQVGKYFQLEITQRSYTFADTIFTENENQSIDMIQEK